MKENLEFIWLYAKHYKFRLFLMLISILLTSISGALFPFFLGRMINGLIYEKNFFIFFSNFCFYGIFFLFQQLMRFINTKQYAILETSFLYDIRRDALKSVFNKPADFLSAMNRGDIVSRIEKDTHQILDYIYYNLFYSISDIVEFISQIVLIFLISWKLLLLTIICMPLSFILPKICSKILEKYYRKQSELDGKLSGWFFDTINNLVDIHLLSGQDKITKDFYERKEKYINTKNTTSQVEVFSQIGIEGTSVTLKILLYMFSALLVIQKQLLIGNFISVIEYFNSSLSIFNEVANRSNPITENMVAIDRIKEIVSNPKGEIIKTPFSAHNLDIQFKNITFGYENSKSPVLNNISFHIHQGEHVVVAGYSGCGKTTLLRLLMNFYCHYTGNIYIGGKELSRHNDIDLSSQIAVVFQSTALFNGSVRYNLIFTDCNGRDNEIWTVLDRIGLADFFHSLPLNLETELTTDNTHLSGGQIQRLGIARALLMNTPIIIFDEPTSAFDWQSEQMFLDMCKTFYFDKTIIMISHRLETIKAADRVFFINHGTLEAVGKHEELLKTCRNYVQYLNQGDSANGN